MKLQTHRELDDDLSRIERLIEAATAGPWYSYAVGRDAEDGSNRTRRQQDRQPGFCRERSAGRAEAVARSPDVARQAGVDVRRGNQHAHAVARERSGRTPTALSA